MGIKPQTRPEFTYWKRPWHKWLVLAAALLQLLCLWMNIQECNDISKAGILSASEWADYVAQKNWQCAINGMMAACCLGTFFVGLFVRSQKEARLIDGLLLLFLALAWGVTGVALQLISLSGKGLFWLLILLIAFGGAAHSLLQYYKNRSFL